jgi:hypothetical protein
MVASASLTGCQAAPARPKASSTRSIASTWRQSAQAWGRSAEIAPENAGTAAEERAVEQAQEALRNRYSVRTDSGPVALQAFWGMHIEAMNWSGMGHAEYTAALGLSPHALRIWRDRLEQSGKRNGLAIPALPECPGSIKQLIAHRVNTARPDERVLGI